MGQVFINGKAMQKTSLAAFDAIQGDLPKQEGMVFRVIRDAGAAGISLWKIVEQHGMHYPSASARITGLKLKKLIRDSGKRSITPSGKQAIRWVTV